MKILAIKELDAQELRYVELLKLDLERAKKTVSETERAIQENFRTLREKHFPETLKMPKGSPIPLGGIPTLEIHDKHLVVVRHDY